MKLLSYALFATGIIYIIVAECPNACSSHGKCAPYEMCMCFRNWMGNDCSQRVCQFGNAHMDTPKGDLDASDEITGPGKTILANDQLYPYGTQEKFPNMAGSDGVILENTAHSYYECSNKGICDRRTGTCTCFPGYDGSACQRQSCPKSSAGVCSGHGVCESIRKIANRDFANVYRLWDEEITMGCVCDGGYTGPDCSQKICKYGADPLYYDDDANIRYSNFTYHFYTRAAATLSGNYSLWFEDRTGEDWQTSPISITGTCHDVTLALESLPNNVIPTGSVRCYQHPLFKNTNVPIYSSAINTVEIVSSGLTPKFTLAFSGNPGYLKQININRFLDGASPTLYTNESVYPSSGTLGIYIYANGFTGEDTDYVPDRCEGVFVTIASTYSSDVGQLSGISTAEAKKLKRCLGDSNNNPSDNVELYSWDYGNVAATVKKQDYSSTTKSMAMPNPHLIKLVDRTQDSWATTDEGDVNQYPYPVTQLCPSLSDMVGVKISTTGWCSDKNRPGFYAVLYYDGTYFNIFSKIGYVANIYSTTTEFTVYTTTGYLQRVSPVAVAANQIIRYSTDSSIQVSTASTLASYHTNVFYTLNTSVIDDTYFGQVDCETNPKKTGFYAADCLEKEDLVMFLNTDTSSTTALTTNPIFPNMYRVKKIFTDEPIDGFAASVAARQKIVLDYGVNAHYTYDNGATYTSAAYIYKFHPPRGYNYVGQCSNRGICDVKTGLCDCFRGFSGDNCGKQDALVK